MTMPHLMNCSHAVEGWCLDCVKKQYDEAQQAHREAMQQAGRCQSARDEVARLNRVVEDAKFRAEQDAEYMRGELNKALRNAEAQKLEREQVLRDLNRATDRLAELANIKAVLEESFGAETSRLKGQLESVRAELDVVNANFVKMVAERDDALAERDEALAGRNAALEQYKASTGDDHYAKLAKELEFRLARWRRRVCGLDSALFTEQDKTKRLQERVSGLQNALANEQSTSTTLKGQLVETRKERDEFVAKVHQLRHDLAATKSQLEDPRKKMTAVETRLEQRNTILQRRSIKLKNQLAYVRQERDKYVAQIVSLKDQVTRLQGLVDGRDKTIAMLCKEVDKLRAENERDVAQVQGESIANLCKEIDKLRAEKEQQVTRIQSEAGGMIAERDTTIAKLQHDVYAVTKQLEDSRQKMAALLNVSANQQRENRELRGELTLRSHSWDNALAQTVQLKRENRELKGQLDRERINNSQQRSAALGAVPYFGGMYGGMCVEMPMAFDPKVVEELRREVTEEPELVTAKEVDEMQKLWRENDTLKGQYYSVMKERDKALERWQRCACQRDEIERCRNALLVRLEELDKQIHAADTQNANLARQLTAARCQQQPWNGMGDQARFNMVIGNLDQIISELMLLVRDPDMSEVNKQTLKHHGEDMVAAGNAILKRCNNG